MNSAHKKSAPCPESFCKRVADTYRAITVSDGAGNVTRLAEHVPPRISGYELGADIYCPKEKGAAGGHALWVASVDHSSGVSGFGFRRWCRFNIVPCSVSAIRSDRAVLRPLYSGFHLPHRPVEFSNASSRRKRIGFAGEEPSNLSLSDLPSSGLVMDYAPGVSDSFRPCRFLSARNTLSGRNPAGLFAGATGGCLSRFSAIRQPSAFGFGFLDKFLFLRHREMNSAQNRIGFSSRSVVLSSGGADSRFSVTSHPFGSMPCRRNSTRASSFIQLPRLTPSRSAAASSCSLNSGASLTLNMGDFPDPFGLLSLLMAGMYRPGEVVLITLGLYTNVRTPKKTTPRTARTVPGRLTTTLSEVTSWL